MNEYKNQKEEKQRTVRASERQITRDSSASIKRSNLAKKTPVTAQKNKAQSTTPPDHIHQVVELLLELRADRRLQPRNTRSGCVLLGSHRLLAFSLRFFA